jgi:predicted RNA-binding Zn-ribbon protein involved in translation (DUF1610 family)
MAEALMNLGPKFKCPVCGEGEVHHFQMIRRLRADEHEYRCTHCGGLFKPASAGQWQLISVPAAYSYVGDFYKGQSRTAEDWQAVVSISNEELEKLETDEGSLLAQLSQSPKRSPLMLQEDEVALVVVGVQYLEDRSMRMRTAPGLSAGIRGTGLRVYTPASYQSEDVRTLLDEGTFVLTNKRYAFVGPRKTVSAKLDKIVAVNLYQDGFSVARTGKQKVEFFTKVPGAFWGVVIRRLLSELQQLEPPKRRRVKIIDVGPSVDDPLQLES